MLVFFSLTIVLAIGLIIFILFLTIFLSLFRKSTFKPIGHQTSSGSSAVKRFWQPMIFLLRKEKTPDYIEYILRQCNLYMFEIDRMQTNETSMNNEKTEILDLPPELVELLGYMRELTELRNQYISKPFGLRKAIRCAKKLAKIKADFWRKVISLYEDKTDLPDLIAEQAVKINYVKGQIMIKKK